MKVLINHCEVVFGGSNEVEEMVGVVEVRRLKEY